MDSQLVMWGLVVGFLSPLVISVIQQPAWSQQIRSLVTFAFAVVAGFGTAFFEGKLNGADITTSVLVVLVTAIATYKGLWAPSGVSPKIESATTFTDPQPPLEPTAPTAMTGVVAPPPAPPTAKKATAPKKPSAGSSS